KIVRPAARPMSQPPNWELLKEDMEYRRLLVTQQQLALAHNPPMDEEDDQPIENGEAEVEEGAVDPFPQGLDAAPERSLEEEIEFHSAPGEGRAYVGVGLISYQHDRHGKQRTEMMVRPGTDIKLSTVNA